MGKLTEFYKQHRRLFIAQKHQNTRQTEKFKDMVLLRFFEYCESENIFHTGGISKKTAERFFNTPEIKRLSDETKRKYLLVINSMFKRYFRR